MFCGKCKDYCEVVDSWGIDHYEHFGFTGFDDAIYSISACCGSKVFTERCYECLGDGILADDYGESETCYACNGVGFIKEI